MANGVRQSLRAVLSRLAVSAVETDQELLARFASNRDEDAFAELVRRHGSMVLGVARRSLGSGIEAEDVCQATFLLLAIKCRKIPTTASLAGWLHGVARRTAANARRATARRAVRERAGTVRSPSASPETTASLRELQTVLDDELARLPEVYRVAFLLCQIEGRSRRETAQLLGCTEGTVSSRLARARDLLRHAIRRRGIELSAVLTAIAVSDAMGSACSPDMAESTLRIAEAVMTNGPSAGVVSPTAAALLRTGIGRKWGSGTGWIAITVCVLAGMGFVFSGRGGSGPPTPRSTPIPSIAVQPIHFQEVDRFEGTWQMSLPAGFKYDVRIEHLGEGRYRLHSETVFAGDYEHQGKQLVLQKPIRGADPQFRWTFDGERSAALTNEALVFGQRYVGATLTRNKPNPALPNPGG